MVMIMFIVHLDEVLGADEAIPLFVKHSESFSDIALNVRVLELPLRKNNTPTEKSCFLKMKIISISYKCIPCHQPHKLIEADVPIPILSTKCRIGQIILKTTQDKSILKTTQDKFKESPGRLHSPGLSAPPQLATSQRFSSPKTPNLARFEVHPHVDEVLEGGFERVVVMMIGMVRTGLVITRGPQTLSSAD